MTTDKENLLKAISKLWRVSSTMVYKSHGLSTKHVGKCCQEIANLLLEIVKELPENEKELDVGSREKINNSVHGLVYKARREGYAYGEEIQARKGRNDKPWTKEEALAESGAIRDLKWLMIAIEKS